MAGNVRRRSSRGQKQSSEHSLGNRGRSRSTSANGSTTRRRNAKSIPLAEKSLPRKRKRSLSSSPEAPRVLRRTVDGRIIDAYCWVCHKFGSESICNSCPRVYHKDCLKKLKGNSNHLPFCECQLKTVDGKNEKLNLNPRELKKLLQYVMQEAIKEEKKSNQKSHKAENSRFCRLFQAWPSENDALCKIVDLNILLDNMNGEEPYLSTGQFFLDVKWIYHNCCVLRGPDCDVTKAAFKLEKNFREELTDMEACPECYYNKYSDNYLHADFFTKICRKPHLIVWAKLRGFPFWPAKCLKIHNGHADVIFFGTHDKSKIPISKCYKISRENPMNTAIHQCKYKESIRELSIYVSNYESLIGPFHFYPRKTVLEDGNASVKKSRRKGHYRLNNAEHVERNVPNSGIQDTHDSESINLDPMETKVKASFQLLGNFPEKHKNATDSVEGVDIDSNVVYHMTFTADEHNGPANEFNNSEEILGSSASDCTFDPNLSLSSLNETPGLLSAAGVLPSSSEIEMSTGANENSLNFLNVDTLPIIASVSANEMPLNELPVITSAMSSNEILPNAIPDGPSTSVSLPVITSAVSTSEREDFASNNIFSQDENSKVELNDLHTDDSSSVPSFSRQLYNSLMKDANCNYLFENEVEDDEIEVIGEEKQNSIAQDYFKNPAVLKAFSEVLLSSKPQMKKSFLSFQSMILQNFLLLWIEITFAKFEKRDVQNFIDLFRKSVKKQDFLKKSLAKSESAKSEAEKARLESEKAKLEAEKGRAEAEKARALLEEELKELKKKMESKSELKDMIIRKATQKMLSKSDRSGDHLEIENLSLQLSDAWQKINIKEENISELREENERLKSLLHDARSKSDTCDFGVQTDLTHFESPATELELDSSLVLNQNQDSSQLLNNPENPNETCNSSQEHPSLLPSDMQVEMQRNTYIVERLSSVSSNSAVNASVVQQVFEQNMLTSECTTVLAAPSAGVINVAAPTLVSVPVVVPSNPVVPSTGPIFLDAESSATFLNSMGSRKSKSKLGSVMKSSVKRKKKNA